MRSLNNTGVTVPGGFRWFCEETKSRVPAVGSMPSYVDFIYACKQHAKANNLPIGSQWEAQIQAQLCIGLGGEWCSEFGYPVPPPGGWGFGVMEVAQGTRMLAQRMIAAKVRRIPSEEAAQRAAICIDCPANQAPIGCSTCNAAALDAAANSVANGAATVHDARLRSCKVSGFSLKAKINVPLDILLETLTEAQKNALPPKCWLK